MDIDFEDTAIGRLENVKKRELIATIGRLNKDERNQFRRLLDDADGKDVKDTCST